eukprot:CAMPEP_0202710654 /NCGR_PEP_ID=MMETSP1385-20130828/22604_1 /ASSEMBLY_ACC=CAM_ASM_000861 /TAXON_ID=933848 /ORGANISM="Elphidium margaritaceum" /LENGTH=62 /DNA_ID=CAMNT_0049370237 /DNA_START=328 /DNA_END=513 /DNA_ORIENTATION=-
MTSYANSEEYQQNEYKGTVESLLNAVVAIQYGKKLRPFFVAYVEAPSALVFECNHTKPAQRI